MGAEGNVGANDELDCQGSPANTPSCAARGIPWATVPSRPCPSRHNPPPTPGRGALKRTYTYCTEREATY